MDKERRVERIIEWTPVAVRRICRPRLNGRVMSGCGKNEDSEGCGYRKMEGKC